jgi:uncharacterized PurR-regulated membrane protein YhhQ (DUF165 family)
VSKAILITACLIAYTFVIIYMAMQIPAGDGLRIWPTNLARFWAKLYTAKGYHRFLGSQLIDVTIFHFLKQTGNRLRSTGSTVISQLFDSFIVLESLFDDW